MYNYDKFINVLFYKSANYSIYEIVIITKISKTTVRGWVNHYYNNYINLQKKYIRQSTDKTKFY